MQGQEPPPELVITRNANYSAFNGGRRTPSDYSQLTCLACGRAWRSKATYVRELPDL
ncbi:hypothetical protein [Streptacidiphilus sp. MAP5-3]|uniref:hypothetical protein n=1 Tax=unclassified Streptacidiphilus TaxID=2643834 RepID=UPI00351585FF